MTAGLRKVQKNKTPNGYPMKSPANFSLSKGFFLRKFLHRHRVPAFTLVELLVVVAIIAILAGLAIGPIQRMIVQGNTAKSMANLRQLGVGVAGYVADNNGYLPSKEFQDPSRLWVKQLYERIYNQPWTNFVPFDTADNMRKTVFFSPNFASSEPKPWRSYGWNNFLQFTRPGATLADLPPKLMQITNAAKIFLIGDSTRSSSLRPDAVSYRNNGKALFLMADFHIELRERQDIPTNNIKALPWGILE
jgi:prepilin-type N-terminal cleavage/methylation domain-containing protein